MYPPFIFVKNTWIFWRQGGDNSDDVTTSKALRRVNDKMFQCFDTSMSTRTHNKPICKKKPVRLL